MQGSKILHFGWPTGRIQLPQTALFGTLMCFCITIIHWGPVASSPSGGPVSPVEPLGWCFTDFPCPAPEDVLCCICVNGHRLLDLSIPWPISSIPHFDLPCKLSLIWNKAFSCWSWYGQHGGGPEQVPPFSEPQVGICEVGNVMRCGKKCSGGYAGETGGSKQMALQALPTDSHSTSGALGRNHTWAFKHVAA